MMKTLKALELKHAWNMFDYKETHDKSTTNVYYNSMNPARPRYTGGNERTIVTSVYNRISIDASAINLRHVNIDQNGRFQDFTNSTLDKCLSEEANIDQTGRAFMQDIVSSMLDEGCIAVVPIEIDVNLNDTPDNAFKIQTMRTGRIVAWSPMKVKVSLYNDRTGNHEEIWLDKRNVAIIENPLYSVMNEPNSTMQRLIRKLSLMDSVDEDISSGNLDLIIQLPYAVKTESRRNLAEERRKSLEEQMRSSKYGVGYIDATEHVTQLNRPVENTFMKQIEYLTNLLFSQLGLTQSILDGTADEETMNNYYNRTIEPILGAIADEFHRKFLSKTARTRGQAIRYFRDPFKLMPVSKVSEIADKFTRNEIMSSNEFRDKIGMKPSKDPSADELRNKNLSQSKEAIKNQNGVNNQDDNLTDDYKEKEDNNIEKEV